jgi:hypothetical protein
MKLCSSIPLAIVALLCARSSNALPPGSTGAFIEQHCVECHDAEMKKGGLDLQALKFDLADEATFKKWQYVFERVRDGEMPPAKKERPAKGDLEKFFSALKPALIAADAADIAAHGRVHSRRLTRTEYEHTLHDLLGIDIPLKDLLPEDRGSHGFETVSDGQQLSHHQLARYLDVADLALDEAFNRALKGDAKSNRFLTPEDLARSGRGNYRGPDLRDGESISWPIGLQFFGRMRATSVDAAGWYRITLKDVRAINPGRDGAVWGTLRSGECESNAPLLYMIGLVEGTAEPRDLVYEAWIQQGHRLELRPNDGEHRKAPTGATGGNVSFVGRDLASEGYPGIAHRGISMERIYPNSDSATVKRHLFAGVNPAKATAGNLDGLITQFARRAFRRPVSLEQTAPYREIGHRSLENGDSFAEALRASYRAILCSPRFLTFIEAPGALDDHAIASRLSYALWVSMPDAQLSRLAAEGRLKKPEVLAQQVDRMLADPKSSRFVASFTDQWLKLKEIDFTTPDPRQFRTFDSVLQQSLLTETRAYFAEMIRSDLAVAKLVDSDFAFLNGRLARHYFPSEEIARSSSSKESRRRQQDNGSDAAPAQQPEPPASSPYALVASALKPGDGLQKVALPPGTPRGGLLTQGAVLKVTADGTTTSPVIRGVFINERILGEHIPPPPPGIPAIEPDTRGATTIREQLEKHRANASCVACHQTIDPPGFALENFDPVGGWRVKYGGSGSRIDASGVTPEGYEFAGFQAWKAIYANRGAQLARSFASQFLTYATGAPPRFSNEAAMNRIVTHTEDGGHGMRSLIREAMLSEVFLTK